MDKAIILQRDVDVTFGCPKCSTPFVYTNDIVPTVIPTYHVCDKCNIPLFIAPVSIHVQFKKPKKAVRSLESRIVKAAKKTVKSYGFSTTEVNNAIATLDFSDMDLATAVKTLLAQMDNHNEQSQTH